MEASTSAASDYQSEKKWPTSPPHSELNRYCDRDAIRALSSAAIPGGPKCEH